MLINVYDPFFVPVDGLSVIPLNWPDGLEKADFIVFTAPLNAATHHMFNAAMLDKVKPGVRIVNIGRGPVIAEQLLASGPADGIFPSDWKGGVEGKSVSVHDGHGGRRF